MSIEVVDVGGVCVDKLVDDGFKVGDGADGWKVTRAAKSGEAKRSEDESKWDAMAVEIAQ